MSTYRDPDSVAGQLAGMRAPALTANRRLQWAMAASVLALTLVTFLPALGYGFVYWDDNLNFLANPYYRGLGRPQLRWIWTTFHMGHYIPVTWMSLALDYVLWGMNPAGYHLTSVFLHTANAILFYLIAERLLKAALSIESTDSLGLRLGAAAAALLFAVHPLRVESVVWISERRDVLAGFFYLLTVFCYLSAVRRPGDRPSSSARWYMSALACFALALLSKATAVTLPIVLLVLDIYPLRRLGGPERVWTGPKARSIWLEKVPFLILSGAAGAMALYVSLKFPYTMSLERLGWVRRAAIACYAMAFYLWKTLIPISLSPLYELLPDRVNPLTAPFLSSIITVVLLTAVVVKLRADFPALLAIWVGYVATLLPVSGIFQTGPQLVADRYTYLATLGWALVVGGGVTRVWLRWTHGTIRRALAWCLVVSGIAAATGLVTLTSKQIRIWRSSEALWSHAVTTSPSAVAHSQLGAIIAQQGRVGEAIEHFRASLQLNPRYAIARNNLGSVLATEGRLDEAIEQFEVALRLDPSSREARANLERAERLRAQARPHSGSARRP